MSRENQSPWPRVRTTGSERRSPTGFFQTPDVIQKSTRSLAGPLRTGTAPGVGPKGPPGVVASDFEMDRITPRTFDPMGTERTREPNFPASASVSKQVRSSSRKD
jgi:hypothetical protein